MKLSNETLSVLKNFGNINQGIQFKKGKVLKTVSSHKNILAEVTINEDVPSDFAIYDLNRFLSVLSLHDESTEIELDENNKAANLKSGRKKTSYKLCAIEMIKNSPDKTIVMPSVDVSFTLSSDDLDAVMKSAAVLGSPHIAVKSDGAKIVVAQLDNKDSSSHSSELEIAEGDGKKYNMVFKTEHLRMIPGSYTVSISFRGIASFKHTEKSIQYWIATEAGSTKE